MCIRDRVSGITGLSEPILTIIGAVLNGFAGVDPGSGQPFSAQAKRLIEPDVLGGTAVLRSIDAPPPPWPPNPCKVIAVRLPVVIAPFAPCVMPEMVFALLVVADINIAAPAPASNGALMKISPLLS